MTLAEGLIERGLLPDAVVRLGIRRLLRQRLRRQRTGDVERAQEDLMAHIAACDRAPIAIATDAANAQHYMVPPEFFARVLGRHRKYSCGLWGDGAATLDDAAAAMLRTTCQRGALQDGMSVLDLGCGWGALSLWIARHYPNCRVLGVSNSASQREDILDRAREQGLHNVDIVTADVNTFDPGRTFDRLFSVEMLEHTRNWRELLRRAAGWLDPAGLAFVHVFTHRSTGYAFDTDGDGDWMARRFFTGGQMPADAQMLHFQDDLRIVGHWRVDGRHYARTAEAWLANMDAARRDLRPLFERTWGRRAAAMWHDWRTFFLACAELWGFAGGSEWFVSHYALRPRRR